jgi:hypothetical protein
VRWVGAVACAIGLAGWLWQVRAGDEARPAALPSAAALPADGSASVWVFVRAGCGHCRAHLRELGVVLAALPPTRRTWARARLRIVGRCAEVPAGLTPLPDSLRGAAGVHRVPSTWLVDGRGQVQESWDGARGARAWRRLLMRLETTATSP